MQLQVHKPRADLGRFVESLWSLSDAPAHGRERIFPSGTIELVINLADDRFRIGRPGMDDAALHRLPGAIVSGCYRRPFEFDTRAHASVIGVHFRPGGAAALLGVPPGELADTHVSLEDLWGRAACELRERLCDAAGTHARFQVLERALYDRLALGCEPRPSVMHAVAALERPASDVGRVTKELGLSRRRLIEVFTEDVGMTPKRYARVRRFQRSLAAALAAPSPRWSALALEHGYFDHAHLCREWSELAGVSPSELLALQKREVKANHLALGEAGSNLSKTRGRSLPTLMPIGGRNDRSQAHEHEDVPRR